MKRIRKNSFKKIQSIISSATSLQYYTLSNEFNPQTSFTKQEEIKQIIESILSNRFDSIYENDNGVVVFRIHSNYWVEVNTKKQEA